MPSIGNGLFAARAGIQGHGAAIAVLADNIANSNTTGYKASRADFADLLAGTLGGSGNITVGSGSEVIGVTPVFNQGTLEFTGRGLDLAIEGDGFFVVQETGTTGRRLYSRAGNFQTDEDGNVVNQNGYQVLGFPANGSGGLEALNVNSRNTNSIESSAVTISGNLDASSALTSVPAGTPTFAQLNNAASFSTFVDVYDALGAAHTVTVFFFHTAANTWTAGAYVDAGDIGGTAGAASSIGSATLAFTGAGARTTTPTADITATPAWGNGATAGSFTMLFDPLTQYSASSSVSSITQDGTGSGNVIAFSVDEDGVLSASLDNGQTETVGTVALATFANKESLDRVGGSLFAESTTSGEPVIGTPGTGLFGSIESGALELSTSDIAADFIKLITLQRGFQSSSRIITNIDDLMREIVNIA